jgi:hypothetical protein
LYIEKRRLYREKDEEQRERFTDFVKMSRPSRLFYVDESGINEYLHREYGRARREEKIFAKVPGKKFAGQSIVATKCENRVLAPFDYEGTCNSELFLFWVKNLLIPNLKKRQIVIMDNASTHKSKEVQLSIPVPRCY